MTPDELRALAEALDPSGKVLTHPGNSALQRAADYLRAQADAQPVAWRCEVRGDGTDPKLGAVDWRHYHTTTSKREAQAFVARCGNGIEGRAVPLYANPAPAVPHYAMLDSHRRLVEQAIQSAEHPSGMSTHDGKAHIDASILRRMLAIIDSAPAVPQAEPKPTPASGNDLNVYKEMADNYRNDAERAAYERAAQACEAQISGSDHHYLATHGHWDHMAQAATNCAAAIRALGREK